MALRQRHIRFSISIGISSSKRLQHEILINIIAKSVWTRFYIQVKKGLYRRTLEADIFFLVVTDASFLVVNVNAGGPRVSSKPLRLSRAKPQGGRHWRCGDIDIRLGEETFLCSDCFHIILAGGGAENLPIWNNRWNGFGRPLPCEPCCSRE